MLKFAARTREVMTTVSTPAKATTGLTAGRGTAHKMIKRARKQMGVIDEEEGESETSMDMSQDEPHADNSAAAGPAAAAHEEEESEEEESEEEYPLQGARNEASRADVAHVHALEKRREALKQREAAFRSLLVEKEAYMDSQEERITYGARLQPAPRTSPVPQPNSDTFVLLSPPLTRCHPAIRRQVPGICAGGGAGNAEADEAEARGRGGGAHEHGRAARGAAGAGARPAEERQEDEDGGRARGGRVQAGVQGAIPLFTCSTHVPPNDGAEERQKGLVAWGARPSSFLLPIFSAFGLDGNPELRHFSQGRPWFAVYFSSPVCIVRLTPTSVLTFIFSTTIVLACCRPKRMPLLS